MKKVIRSAESYADRQARKFIGDVDTTWIPFDRELWYDDAEAEAWFNEEIKPEIDEAFAELDDIYFDGSEVIYTDEYGYDHDATAIYDGASTYDSLFGFLENTESKEEAVEDCVYHILDMIQQWAETDMDDMDEDEYF